MRKPNFTTNSLVLFNGSIAPSCSCAATPLTVKVAVSQATGEALTLQWIYAGSTENRLVNR